LSQARCAGDARPESGDDARGAKQPPDRMLTTKKNRHAPGVALMRDARTNVPRESARTEKRSRKAAALRARRYARYSVAGARMKQVREQQQMLRAR